MMHPELFAVLQDLRSLAQHRGLAVVAAGVDTVLQQPPPLLVVAPSAVEMAPFTQWLAERVPALPLQTATYRELDQEPLPLVVAARVLCYLRSQELPEAAAIRVCQRAVEERSSTQCLAVFGAERLTEEAALQFVERVASTLPPPLDTAARQEPALLWSPSPRASAMPQRLEQDAARLVAWLTTPAVIEERIVWHQAWALLLRAEDCLHALTVTPVGSSPQERRQAVDAALTTLNDFCDAVQRRIQSTAAATREVVIATLRLIEQELSRGIGPYLDQHLPWYQEHLEAAQVHATLEPYITQVVHKRFADVQAQVEQQCHGLVTQLEDLADKSDWQGVNALVAGSQPPAAYPQVFLDLFRAWRDEPELPSLWHRESAWEPRGALRSTDDPTGWPGARGLLTGAAGGALLFVALRWVFLLGTVVGVVGGVLAGEVLRRRVSRAEFLQRSEAAVAQQLRGEFNGRVDEGAQITQRVFATLEARVAATGADLRRLLHEARTATEAPPPPVPTDPDLARLDECRNRLLRVQSFG